MVSPWAFGADILPPAPPEEECGSDRFYLAVVKAIINASGPNDSPADVLIGVTEALCFLYLQFLDPRKAKSPKDNKALLLANVDAAYDLVAGLIAESRKRRL